MRYYNKSELLFPELNVREDLTRCAVEVSGRHRFKHYLLKRQCGNKRGYGPGDIYCRVHARQVVVGEKPGFGVPEDEE